MRLAHQLCGGMLHLSQYKGIHRMFADGSIMSRILGTLILLAIIFGPIYLFIRYRNSSWTGIVTDKKVKEDQEENLGTTHTHILCITKDGAKKPHDKSVSSKVYDQFAIGDKVTKQAGKMGLLKV